MQLTWLYIQRIYHEPNSKYHNAIKTTATTVRDWAGAYG